MHLGILLVCIENGSHWPWPSRPFGHFDPRNSIHCHPCTLIWAGHGVLHVPKVLLFSSAVINCDICEVSFTMYINVETIHWWYLYNLICFIDCGLFILKSVNYVQQKYVSDKHESMLDLLQSVSTSPSSIQIDKSYGDTSTGIDADASKGKTSPG